MALQKTEIITVASGFSYPHGITKASDGSFFIADQNNNQIKKLIPQKDGTYKVVEVAGNIKGGYKDGAMDSALFNFIGAIAIDQHDNLFISDTWNHCVRLLELNKKRVCTFLPSIFKGPSDVTANTKLNRNRSLAIDRKSEFLYVLDRTGLLVKIHINSRICVAKSDVGNSSLPRGLVVDLDDNIYYTTASDVQKMDKNFQNLEIVCSFSKEARSLCLDHSCRFLFVGTNTGVLRINLHTKEKREICEIDWASGMALDGRGSLLVCEYSKGNVKKVKIAVYVPWKRAKLVWLGHLKNRPEDCYLARVPPEMVRYILEYCDDN